MGAWGRGRMGAREHGGIGAWEHGGVGERVTYFRPRLPDIGLLEVREWGKLWTREQWQVELGRRGNPEFIEQMRTETGSGQAYKCSD